MELGRWGLYLLPGLLALSVALAVMVARLGGQMRRCQEERQKETEARRATEAALQKSEARYEDLFEHVGLGLFQITPEGRLIRANAAMAEVTGYRSAQEMIAAIADARAEFGIPELTETDDGYEPEPIRYQTEIRGRNEQSISAQVNLRLVRGDTVEGCRLEGSVEDITERRRAIEVVEAQRDLGIQLNATSSLKDALALCLDAAMYTSGMDCGEIYLRDAETGAAVLTHGMGHRATCLRNMRIHAGRITTFLNRLNEPVHVSDQACESGSAEGCDACLMCRVIVPIRHEGARIGWLVMRSHSEQQVPTVCRTALEMMAAQIGSAVVRVQAQEALATSQYELRKLFDSLNDFLFILDPGGHVVDANRAFIARSGYTLEELQAMSLTSLLPIRLEHIVSGGLLGGEMSSVSVPLLAKDGSAIPVETRLGLGRWDGRGVVIGLGRDLSERRKAEEQTASLREKTALLKEIHHRVKNNLQIICSLLRLQVSRLEPGLPLDAFRESQARIRAIALLHEKLYQSQDLSRVELGEYLGALTRDVLGAYYRPTQEIEFQLEAEPLMLNQDTVMPCGLIVNELVTNTCKYAFPDGRRGTLRLAVKKGEDNQLSLKLSDNGVGLPAEVEPSKTNTLGLQLVDDMVAQLKGTWTVQRSGGTTFEIRFPAEKK